MQNDSVVLDELSIDGPATRLYSKHNTLATGNVCDDSFDYVAAMTEVTLAPPKPEFIEKDDEEIKQKNEEFISFIQEVEVLFSQSKPFEMIPNETQQEVPKSIKEKQVFNAITITEMKYDEDRIYNVL